jgi:uncharacterized protein YyaL (SSP411 family)
MDAARRAAQRVWDIAWDGSASRLKHGLYRGQAQGEGFLDDYALLVRGLLAMHRASGERVWLTRARQLGDAMLRTFLADSSGALRLTLDTRSLIFAPLEQGDAAYPAGISAAVDALGRLYDATHSKRYQRAALSAARQLSMPPERWPVAVAALNGGIAASSATGEAEKSAPAVKSAHDTAAHVHVSAALRSTTDADEIAVTLQIDPGFHINANPASHDYLIPTTLHMPGVSATQVRYPAPELFKPSFAPDGVKVYAGKIELVARIEKGGFANATAVRATVEAQACTDTTCLPPSRIAVIVRVKR